MRKCWFCGRWFKNKQAVRGHLAHCAFYEQRIRRDAGDELAGYELGEASFGEPAPLTPEEIADLAAQRLIERMHPNVVYQCSTCGLAVVGPRSDRMHEFPCPACVQSGRIPFSAWFQAGAWNAIGRTTAPQTQDPVAVEAIPNIVAAV